MKRRKSDEPEAARSIDARSCTLEARALALEKKGLKCAGCGSYAVVPKQGAAERYTCCGCGQSGPFSAFVSVRRRR